MRPRPDRPLHTEWRQLVDQTGRLEVPDSWRGQLDAAGVDAQVREGTPVRWRERGVAEVEPRPDHAQTLGPDRDRYPGGRAGRRDEGQREDRRRAPIDQHVGPRDLDRVEIGPRRIRAGATHADVDLLHGGPAPR